MLSPPPTGSIVVAGAGPSALCVAAALVERAPWLRDRLTVVDPGGSWLEMWTHQLAAQEIMHLRSGSVHHPDPAPYALLDFSRTPPRLNSDRSSFVLDGGFDLPSTELFACFCDDVVERYELATVVRGGQITSVGARRRGDGVSVTLDSGELLDASYVVHAGNPRRQNRPAWATDEAGELRDPRIRHSAQVDLRTWNGEGERILVIGGGLTAVQLAIGASRRGARVVLASRRELTIRQFDVEPGWLGPRQLDPFGRLEDWSRRWELVDGARGGGSVPPFAHRSLRAAVDAGAVDHRAGAVVDSLSPDGSHLGIRWIDGGTDRFDEAWLATGSRPDVTACPLLSQIRCQHPARVVGGLPVIEPDLRWPGTDVFLVGALTALHLGPTAGILAGQRRAAERIASAVTDTEPARSARGRPLPPTTKVVA